MTEGHSTNTCFYAFPSRNTVNLNPETHTITTRAPVILISALSRSLLRLCGTTVVETAVYEEGETND